MRVEKRFLAYGHDLDTDINPIQARLAFAIDWQSDFVGKESLLQLRDQANTPVMMSILLDDAGAVPLGNEPVYYNGKIIGKTTSAAYGYRIGQPVALAFITANIASDLEGISVEIDIAGDRYGGSASFKAAYDPDATRMRRVESG
jgi:4-methylaminobutanoate oxidase (formaldehyde-forming)